MWILIAVVLMAFGAPIACCLGASALYYYAFVGNINMSAFPTTLYSSINSFTFLAIPFFILAGNLMNASGVTDKLINLSKAMVGGLQGGLGHVSVIANMFFATISGSAVASCAAIGSIMIPSLEEDGYDKAQATGICVASSCIGPMIPPSIPMIVYSITAGTSIAAMFLAGAVPGVILGLMLMVYCTYLAKKNNIVATRKFSFRVLWKTFLDSLVALVMPVIILGGIYGGMYTPTEAATIAVFYAIVVGLFVTKKLKLKHMPKILFDSAVASSVLMLVVGMATALSRILTILQIPQAIANELTAMTSNKIIILLLLNLLLLFVGCLMDLGAAVVMFVPCLLPLAEQLGLNLVHFGAMVTINLIIGFFTPPVGVCLYVGTSVGNVTIEELCKVIMPFVVIGIALALIVTFVPAVTLWLPTMMGY